MFLKPPHTLSLHPQTFLIYPLSLASLHHLILIPLLHLLMRALVFAAGLGTRLRPLTDTMPKAMVPVCGKPLLHHTISRLVNAGATEIVVNVHHFAEQIIDYVAQHDWGIPVRISDERKLLLNTGGGLRQALALFSPSEAPILIHNVDILSNADLCALYHEAQQSQADALLLVSERKTQRYLLFDDNHRLMGWENIATHEVRSPCSALIPSNYYHFAFSGIHFVSPRLATALDFYPETFPIMDFYLNECQHFHFQAKVVEDLHLLDVGKLDTLSAAETFLQTESQG